MQRISFSNIEPNTTITVDNQEVAVNNHVLALSSSYFDRYFFDQRFPAAQNIELPPMTTVEDFKRLLTILPPEERGVHDDCVEAILILADRFAMDSVLELGRNFLNFYSRKPKLFKFRMAHKYGWNEIKCFSDGVNFVKNAMEFGLLDDEAKAAITAHHSKLVSGNYIEEERSPFNHRRNPNPWNWYRHAQIPREQ